MNLRKIKLLFIAPTLAYRQVKAEDYCARKEYAKANHLLEIISTYFQHDPEHHLLRATVAYQLEYVDECETHLVAFYRAIETNGRYSDDERNYMWCYADRILNKVKGEKGRVAIQYRGDYAAIRENRLSKRLRTSFPLHLV